MYQRDPVLNRLDIEQLFVQSEIDQEAFLTLPMGVMSSPVTLSNSTSRHTGSGKVQEYSILIPKLVEFGFKPCASDPCLFRLASLSGKEVRAVGIYVDELIITHETRCCRELRAFLLQTFPTKDLRNLSNYAGC